MATSIQDAAIAERIARPIPIRMEGRIQMPKTAIGRIMDGFVCRIE